MPTLTYTLIDPKSGRSYTFTDEPAEVVRTIRALVGVGLRLDGIVGINGYQGRA